MLFERDYSNADLRKSLPPIPVRVSRRSQLIAALRQNERPIVIEDQRLAGPFVRLLRVREWQIRCRAGSISPTELTSRRIGTWADMFCQGTCKR
jgi:hypothetical protein